MAIVEAVDILLSQLWPQQDARDPLGIWGSRLGVTGDATGGSIKVVHQVSSQQRAAFVLAVYAITTVQLSGVSTGASVAKHRILTNWPDVDTDAGVRGFGTARYDSIFDSGDLTAPIAGILGRATDLMGHNDRFILVFDPRPQTSLGAMAVVEAEWDDNVDAATYAFEAYGYFWDRSVLSTPGGPRHPGAN